MFTRRDEYGHKCPIAWKSRVSRRVVKSTIEAEALGMGDGMEMAVYINELWMELTGEGKMNVVVKTDSKTLERAIKSSNGVVSRRLRIDIAALRQMIERKELNTVEWVCSGEQVADCLTKEKNQNKSLWTYLKVEL